MVSKVWIQGEDLLGEPYCENWREIIADPTIKAIGKNLKFQRGNRSKQGSMAGSAHGSLRGFGIASSQYVGDNDAEMKDIIEEQKKEVAVPSNFGNLGNNSNSGKRLPSTILNGL